MCVADTWEWTWSSATSLKNKIADEFLKIIKGKVASPAAKRDKKEAKPLEEKRAFGAVQLVRIVNF